MCVAIVGGNVTLQDDVGMIGEEKARTVGDIHPTVFIIMFHQLQ